jgi:hypothetical protein
MIHWVGSGDGRRGQPRLWPFTSRGSASAVRGCKSAAQTSRGVDRGWALTAGARRTALAQAVIFVLSGSVALLADLIHNFGDAATAIPLAVAFSLRSERAERVAGLFVVAAIFVSACVAGVEAVQRLVSPETPTTSQLSPLRAASAMGGTGWPRSSGRGRGCGSTARLWSLTAITREPTRT